MVKSVHEVAKYTAIHVMYNILIFGKYYNWQPFSPRGATYHIF